MTEHVKFCKCGFKAIEGVFVKTDGACPVCGKGMLDGATDKTQEELNAIKENLPRGGQ